jgi:hypothetical protein
MERNHYLFSVTKKNIFVPIQRPIKYEKKIIESVQGLQGPEGIQGPEGLQGPPGKDGDRFCTKTTYPTTLRPEEDSIIAINVEPGLAYISGNSVIVAEVPTSMNADLYTFEGTIQYYNKVSGHIIIKDITNIHGDFGTHECYYHVNLDGVDGAQGDKGEKGDKGDQGPSNVSETHLPIVLLDNTILLPEQEYPITYYTMNVENGNEITKIQSHLKMNQQAILLIELSDLYENDSSSATIYPISEIYINYNKNIHLHQDCRFVMLKIYNINNNVFLESVPFFTNKFISL